MAIIINFAITALIIFIYEKDRRTTLKKLLITFTIVNLALHTACKELEKYTNENDETIRERCLKKAGLTIEGQERR